MSAQGNALYTTVNLNIINRGVAILAVPWTLTLRSAAYGNIRQVQELSQCCMAEKLRPLQHGGMMEFALRMFSCSLIEGGLRAFYDQIYSNKMV